MAGEVLQGDMSAGDWQAGFSHSAGGLCCDICRCIVRQSPGDTKAHLAWHERIEGAGGG